MSEEAGKWTPAKIITAILVILVTVVLAVLAYSAGSFYEEARELKSMQKEEALVWEQMTKASRLLMRAYHATDRLDFPRALVTAT